MHLFLDAMENLGYVLEGYAPSMVRYNESREAAPFTYHLVEHSFEKTIKFSDCVRLAEVASAPRAGEPLLSSADALAISNRTS